MLNWLHLKPDFTPEIRNCIPMFHFVSLTHPPVCLHSIDKSKFPIFSLKSSLLPFQVTLSFPLLSKTEERAVNSSPILPHVHGSTDCSPLEMSLTRSFSGLLVRLSLLAEYVYLLILLFPTKLEVCFYFFFLFYLFWSILYPSPSSLCPYPSNNL